MSAKTKMVLIRNSRTIYNTNFSELKAIMEVTSRVR